MPLILVAIVAACALIGAYQVRPTQAVKIGDAAHDAMLLKGFYGPERQPISDGGVRYRWMGGEGEIAFPGLGRGAARVALTLNPGGNPGGMLQVLANGGELQTLALQPGFVTYTVEVPAVYLSSGNLTLTLRTTPFSPPGDRRMLGAVVSRIVVTPVQGSIVPPARTAGTLWLAVMGVAVGLLVAGVGRVVAVGGAIIAAGALAFGLIADRMFVTTDVGGIVSGSVAMIAVAALVRVLVPPVCRWRGMAVSARDVCWLAAIAGVVVALRLAGSLHPEIAIVDLRFHLNRLSDVVDHHQLLLRIVSTEAGEREVLYAPTPYLVLWPLTLLVRNRVLLLISFALAIDAARFCVLWGVGRVVTGGNRGANLTVATMAAMPVGWIVYSWGIYANIFAEGMLTLLFALLVLAYGRLAGPRRWLWMGIFALVICVTLLAHLGVLVLTAAVVALYACARLVEGIPTPRPLPRGGGECRNEATASLGTLWTRKGALPFPRRRDGGGRGVGLFILAGVLAAVVAFAVFYRIPAGELLRGTGSASTAAAAVTTSAPRLYRTGGATPDERIGLDVVQTHNLAVAIALEAWFMAHAFYNIWPVIAAMIGGVLLARRGFRERFGPRTAAGDAAETAGSHAWDAALTIGVWLAVALVMLVVGLVLRLYVRYPLYALPAVALGTGVALGALVQRWGRWGRVVVAALLLFSAVSSLLMWYDHIVYALKPVV